MKARRKAMITVARPAEKARPMPIFSMRLIWRFQIREMGMAMTGQEVSTAQRVTGM